MLDRILSLLNRSGAAEAPRRLDRLHLAAACLLVEAARMDEGLTSPERRHIAELLAERFSLGGEETAALLAEAEQETDRSSQLFAFTR